jgi:hypothetical protein
MKCAIGGAVEIQRELDSLISKRDRVRQLQMSRWDNGSATRARTTSSNAEVDRINERIVWLREQLKEVSSGI